MTRNENLVDPMNRFLSLMLVGIEQFTVKWWHLRTIANASSCCSLDRIIVLRYAHLKSTYLFFLFSSKLPFSQRINVSNKILFTSFNFKPSRSKASLHNCFLMLNYLPPSYDNKLIYCVHSFFAFVLLSVDLITGEKPC